MLDDILGTQPLLGPPVNGHTRNNTSCLGETTTKAFQRQNSDSCQEIELKAVELYYVVV